MAIRPPPMTGRRTGRRKSMLSATTSPAITAGTIRRLFCSWLRLSQRCRTCWRPFSGWRRPLPAFVAAMATILGGRTGLLVACGFPAATWNVTAGQNGFLTAALIGGTLGLMERRTALAGVCLGLLTYKPQFGLLFPNRADRRPAMAHDRGRLLRRRRSCCAVMARLWQCQLASHCALDADHQQFCRYGKVVRHSN